MAGTKLAPIGSEGAAPVDYHRFEKGFGQALFGVATGEHSRNWLYITC